MNIKFNLFSAYGVELEYMIVNRDTLAVCPIADQIIHDICGQYENEVEFEHIAWSNELVLHVLELKTNGPASSLQPLTSHFQNEVTRINHLLSKYNAKLLPTGCHPFMDPYEEAKLWPHGNNEIYEAYDQIFDCRGHGWSNLQSVHLNLPFADDDEFAKLHSAIRLILPLIPALSASTPLINGKLSGILDTRLEFYRTNQEKLPLITGKVIPELVLSKKEYEEKILQPMYDQISPHDPEGTLQEEWLNSRGAIARFDRNSIEIRIIDSQECPKAELAIITFIVVILKSLVHEEWLTFERQTEWSEDRLSAILMACVKDGLLTVITDEDYPLIFGLPRKRLYARELLLEVLEKSRYQMERENVESLRTLEIILQHGNLAERIITGLNDITSKNNIIRIYQNLAACLAKGQLYLP